MMSQNCPVSFTEDAMSFVASHLKKNNDVLGLRLGVEKSGCSGLGYVVDYAKSISDSDNVYEAQGMTEMTRMKERTEVRDGFKVIIDEKSLPYIKGMIVDCITQGLNKNLTFKNPNATGACGCGESFSVG